MSERPAPTTPNGVTRQDVFALLGGLGAILTLATAVMYYFGWRRTDVQARAMGIDVSLFGFTTQDYVLRSISSLYLPGMVLAALALAWYWAHARIVRLLRSEAVGFEARRAIAARWLARAAALLAAIAVGSLLVTLAVGVSSPPAAVAWLADELRPRQWVLPGVLVGATLAASYLWWIYRQLRPAQVTGPRSLWQTLLPIALVAGAVTLGAFWLLEEYATVVGVGYADQVTRSVDSLARAVVISPAPLGLEAPGVHEERLGAAGAADVRYRTTGLRLLARSGGKVLLVHDGWTPRSGTVIVIADKEELSWQFSR